jgi:anion transporter
MKPSVFTLQNFIVLMAGSAGFFLLLFPLESLGAKASGAAGIALITIALFATAKIPEHLTALLFFLLAMLFGVAPASVVFSGFQSTALWLVFGGLAFGVAMVSTGLGNRIARNLASHFDGTYLKLITGMTMLGMVFAFIMPSAMGRVLLITPIALSLAGHFGFKDNTNGKTGVVLATILGAFIPAFSILPANVPNMVLTGMAESQFGITVLYGEYLLLHFPVLGLLKSLMIIVLIVRLFPDEPKIELDDDQHANNPTSREEKILIIVLIIALGLWVTDFAHHISPAWVALAGALFLFLPVTRVLTSEQFNTKINYGAVFFVASVIGLGGLIQQSGLGTIIGEQLISALPLDPQTPFINYMLVALSSTLTGIATTLPGVPAVMTPLTPEIAQATGFPEKNVLMLQVLGFSTMIMPYQAPAVVVGMRLANIGYGNIVKPVIFIALFTYIVALPLNYVWWKFLGWM